jgi:hypothetical protein
MTLVILNELAMPFYGLGTMSPRTIIIVLQMVSVAQDEADRLGITSTNLISRFKKLSQRKMTQVLLTFEECQEFFQLE